VGNILKRGYARRHYTSILSPQRKLASLALAALIVAKAAPSCLSPSKILPGCWSFSCRLKTVHFATKSSSLVMLQSACPGHSGKADRTPRLHDDQKSIATLAAKCISTAQHILDTAPRNLEPTQPHSNCMT
jgi:hypothetical protein